MVLGPLDKRAIRTRCQACARRKIKCESGPPCTYCVKKNINCVPQATKPQPALVLLNHTPCKTPPSRRFTPEPQILIPSIQRVYSKDASDHFINHFFTSFITKNEFGVSIDLNTITAQFQSSPSLRHALVAVGALDLTSRTSGNQCNESLAAIQSYRASVTRFQSEIQQKDFLRGGDGLWTTFFLGLFELMYDISGEGWVKHILYGTSKILQLRGPEAHRTGSSRSFFLTVRVFEICRSIIYSGPTFLHEESWKNVMSQMWKDDLAKEWHPKETLFDLMLNCSVLSQKVWKVVDPEYQETESTRRLLVEVASSGIMLRNSLDAWSSAFKSWETQNPSSTEDTRSILATIYFHAISIYLSGLFDYRRQFDTIASPALPVDTIQSHVHGILSETARALSTTNLAGLLFFFPLRVAGARARLPDQRRSILEMLREISNRSFVVADAFAHDLENLWQLR